MAYRVGVVVGGAAHNVSDRVSDMIQHGYHLGNWRLLIVYPLSSINLPIVCIIVTSDPLRQSILFPGQRFMPVQCKLKYLRASTVN